MQEALVRAWQQLPSLRDPDGSTPGSIAWWSTPVPTRGDSCGAGRSRSDRSRSMPPSATRPGPSPIGNSWSGASPTEARAASRDRTPLLQRVSAAEIARILDIPEGTARSRLHYATEAMRAALEADARTSRWSSRTGGVMASDRRLERTITRWLEQTAPARVPDRVLEATSSGRGSRQGAGWHGLAGRGRLARAVPVLGGAAVAVVAVVGTGVRALRQATVDRWAGPDATCFEARSSKPIPRRLGHHRPRRKHRGDVHRARGNRGARRSWRTTTSPRCARAPRRR